MPAVFATVEQRDSVTTISPYALVIAGCVAGAVVLFTVVIHVRKKKLAPASSNIKSASSSASSSLPSQSDKFEEMTAMGINLPTAGKKLGLQKPALLQPNTQQNTPNSLSPSRAVVIPRRTSSIGVGNPLGNSDGRNRVSLVGRSNEKRSSVQNKPKMTSMQRENLPLSAEAPEKSRSEQQVIDSIESLASSLSIESDEMDAEDTYEVLEHWAPQRFDELELFPGEMVFVYHLYEDGWCDGRVEGTEENGSFPFACLKPKNWNSYALESEQVTVDEPLAETPASPVAAKNSLGVPPTTEHAKRLSGMLKNIDRLVAESNSAGAV
ncbi:hypothetical protein HDU82_000327 [Entophlyctis luteolus]|nr:hypothetical protein HDU82_000327 [Entophlyctis luteolus]